MIQRRFYLAFFFLIRLLLLQTGIFLSIFVQAQLCNGSLGDPVVNISFGSGPNPGPALAAATTSYGYVTDPCPVNGFYTVLNRGVECNYGWHVLQADHTGDKNGYFMLVDASFEASDFYLDTVKSLCAGTTYEFAAWMLNMKYVTQGTRPNITFSIETETGQVLQTYNSGDIPVEQTVKWKQYGFYFTTPAIASKIILRMTNNAPGGDGNDLALDDITFRPCGQRITSAVAGSISDTVDICENNTSVYSFSATVSSGYLSPVYQWQVSNDNGFNWTDIPGATATSYQRQPSGTGSYWYRFTVAEATNAGTSSCRIASNAVIINVHTKPMVDAGADRYFIRGNTISLQGTVAGESPTVLWSPNDHIDNVLSLSPMVYPLQDMAYVLSATSAYGCTNLDTVLVKILAGLYIPAAFTPNGDGRNDRWNMVLPDAAINVYNRYGQLVFHATTGIISWDGKYKGELQPSGSYVYIVNMNQSNLKIKGTVTLIR